MPTDPCSALCGGWFDSGREGWIIHGKTEPAAFMIPEAKRWWMLGNRSARRQYPDRSVLDAAPAIGSKG